jgi:Sulfotransferase domain
MKKPNLFIVGAPKCGTTAMYEYLKQHPEIYMPAKVKEPNYFNKDIRFHHARMTQDEYLNLFSDAGKEKWIGEASVWYLYSKEAALRIKQFNPTARIIIMLRSPVEMLYSLHSEFFRCADEYIFDFKAALNAEADRRAGVDTKHKQLPMECLFYRQVARYSEQVKRYYDVFGRESVHVILYEDFRRDVESVYRGVLTFLGVADSFKPEFKVANANKKMRSMAVHRLVHYSPLVARRFVRLFLPELLRWKIRMFINRLNFKEERRAPMDDEVRDSLQRELEPDIAQLSKLLRRDLSFWVSAES